MRIFEKIWADIKGLFGKVLKNAPTVINDSLVVIGGLAPLLETIVDTANAPLGLVLAPIIDTVLAGLTELKKLVLDYEANPGVGTLSSVHNAVTVIQTNLTGILTAAKVSNSGSVATITNVVGRVSTDLSVLQSSLAAVLPTPAEPVTLAPPAPPAA